MQPAEAEAFEPIGVVRVHKGCFARLSRKMTP